MNLLKQRYIVKYNMPHYIEGVKSIFVSADYI